MSIALFMVTTFLSALLGGLLGVVYLSWRLERFFKRLSEELDS